MSPTAKIVKARVLVTLEVEAEGCWNLQTEMTQVDKQARESVEDILRRGFVVNGLVFRDSVTEATKDGKRLHHANVIGEPKVTMLVVEDRR